MPVKTLLDPLTSGQLPQTKRAVPDRFKKAWGYKDEEDRFFLGTLPPTTISAHPSDLLYVLEAGDTARPDMISYKYYKTPELYWVILAVNNILDPFEGMYPGMLIRVPTLVRLMQYGII